MVYHKRTIKGAYVRKPLKPKDAVIVKKTKKVKHVSSPKMRSSLEPGRVCIILTGPYKGKRVVLLRTLPSGNVVITGPYCINGVTLRRMNPRYLIASSVKINIESFKKNFAKYDDVYFNKVKTPKSTSKDDSIFSSENQTQNSLDAGKKFAKKEDQNDVDKLILKGLNESDEDLLKQYLKTRFTLRDKMYPHELKF